MSTLPLRWKQSTNQDGVRLFYEVAEAQGVALIAERAEMQRRGFRREDEWPRKSGMHEIYLTLST